MPRWNIFKKHTDSARARRQAIFWTVVPTSAVIICLILLFILLSNSITGTLHYTFDSRHQTFINHSLWWIICVNFVCALLTAAVIGWVLTLYPAFHSLRHYWKLDRSKNKKARKKRTLRWSALALIAVPIALIILWIAIGQAILFVTSPQTQAIPIVNDLSQVGLNYWTVTDFISGALVVALPFCLIIAIYLTVKRSRL